jgi:predicted nucleic acid-binding protein
VETDRHGDVFREVVVEVPFLSGNLVHDAHTAVLMKENGIRTIWTRDADFHRFPFLEVRDPMASDSLVSEGRSGWGKKPRRPR